jgi:DNA polymerase III delta prime subunit
MESFLKDQNIPHILLYGSSNSGKRYNLEKLLNTIYTKEQKKLYTMYIHCSICKGIKVIRDDIKDFAKQQIHQVPFKSIIIYDAELLTIDAQYSLRRCIEVYSKNTRFFIITHNKDKLINPICSRFVQLYHPGNYSVEKELVDLVIKPNSSIKECIDMAEKYYEEGIYGDILLEKYADHQNYTYLKFHYDSICHELKNEKWILFYILAFFNGFLNLDL